MRLRVLALTGGFFVLTMLFGWWAVPLLGLAWGIVAGKTPKASMIAGTSAMVAWGVLLAWSAITGPVGILATKLGSIAKVPGVVFLALTLLLPFLLAASAAAIPLSLREKGPQ
jgi:hypothetical protein